MPPTYITQIKRDRRLDENNKFVRFDWATKHILRNKANFGVLEGLLNVL